MAKPNRKEFWGESAAPRVPRAWMATICACGGRRPTYDFPTMGGVAAQRSLPRAVVPAAAEWR